MDDWKEGLDEKQQAAATHIGKHARLLAGPGTGKTETITRRILALIVEHNVDPANILVLTFTRVAAYDLRCKIKSALDPLKKELPRISTIHSFALRQLMRNSGRITTLPQPLRIADDYDERSIILEDLKVDLEDHLKTIFPDIPHSLDKVKKLFALLSSDWETLRIDLEETQRSCHDAEFLGAWSNHRNIFGYALRSELIYQLKKALNSFPDFNLESKFSHVLVDEYQDLNACDLAIIDELAKRGCELFVAGDDDQSIYGFRYANPNGIRIFVDRFQAEPLALETCFRCDKSILSIGEFVASLDYTRLPKITKPRIGAGNGAVRLLCFEDQYREAEYVAKRCSELFSKGVSDILILIRSDHQSKISSVLVEACNRYEIPVAVKNETDPLDEGSGRCVLAILRLLIDESDALAWRTILQEQCGGVAEITFKSIRDMAREKGQNFYEILKSIERDPTSIRRGNLIAAKMTEVRGLIGTLKSQIKTIDVLIHEIVGAVISDPIQQKLVEDFLIRVKTEAATDGVSDLLLALTSSFSADEQELTADKVNILTMHKAKGLSADVVFIVGAEKQFLPGRSIGLAAEDERRLLFVSLTRARHELNITYCQRRLDQQMWTGSESGTPRRELTPFLKDSPLKAENP